jgi:hypothetical protein
VGDASQMMKPPGASLKSGDHLCALFTGQDQRDEILGRFMQEGLDVGDKVVVVLDDPDPDKAVMVMVRPEELERGRATGRLEVHGQAEPRVLPEDHLTVEEMLDMWRDAVALTRAPSPDGLVRVMGDAKWWVSQTDGETVVRYETRLNRFIPEGMGVLCLFDLDQYPSSLLVDAVRSHPILLLGRMVIENPYYVSPEVREAPGGFHDTAAPTEKDIRTLAGA